MEGQEIRNKVREAYSAAAKAPGGRHAFPVGRAFAESLGYPEDRLAHIDAQAVDAFTGVSNVAVFADIPSSAALLDVGCGAGLDALIAAQRTGAGGHVLGVDFSLSMLNRAIAAARAQDAGNAAFCQADAERLPVATGSIDIALVNGIFNLNPARKEIFGELARVLRQGGKVYAAELVLRAPQGRDEQIKAADWFA